MKNLDDKIEIYESFFKSISEKKNIKCGIYIKINNKRFKNIYKRN